MYYFNCQFQFHNHTTCYIVFVLLELYISYIFYHLIFMY
nr:MAG TPA: hypothetical protein [Caudoviricetes sp.]